MKPADRKPLEGALDHIYHEVARLSDEAEAQREEATEWARAALVEQCPYAAMGAIAAALDAVDAAHRAWCEADELIAQAVIMLGWPGVSPGPQAARVEHLRHVCAGAWRAWRSAEVSVADVARFLPSFYEEI